EAGGTEARRTEARCAEARCAGREPAPSAAPGRATPSSSGRASAAERATRASRDAAFRSAGAASGTAAHPTGQRAVADLLAPASRADPARGRNIKRTARAPAAGAQLHAHSVGGPAPLVFALHAQHAGLERYGRRRKEGLTLRA